MDVVKDHSCALSFPKAFHTRRPPVGFGQPSPSTPCLSPQTKGAMPGAESRMSTTSAFRPSPTQAAWGPLHAGDDSGEDSLDPTSPC